MSYAPTPAPAAGSLRAWVLAELRRAGVAIDAPTDQITLIERHAAPARPYTGLTVLADGTDWDPGSGQGVYTYYGSAWNKLG